MVSFLSLVFAGRIRSVGFELLGCRFCMKSFIFAVVVDENSCVAPLNLDHFIR